MSRDVVIPIVLIVAVLPLAIGILVVRDRYQRWRHRRSPEHLEAERQDFRRRLRQPEWPAIERALGRPVPSVLKRLYEDPAWNGGDEYRVISPYEKVGTIEEHASIALSPATVDSLVRLDSIDVDVFQFATDEFGNPYGVQLFERLDGDGAVFLHMLDGDSVFRIADSLADLLGWPQQSLPSHH